MSGHPRTLNPKPPKKSLGFRLRVHQGLGFQGLGFRLTVLGLRVCSGLGLTALGLDFSKPASRPQCVLSKQATAKAARTPPVRWVCYGAEP